MAAPTFLDHNSYLLHAQDMLSNISCPKDPQTLVQKEQQNSQQGEIQIKNEQRKKIEVIQYKEDLSLPFSTQKKKPKYRNNSNDNNDNISNARSYFPLPLKL